MACQLKRMTLYSRCSGSLFFILLQMFIVLRYADSHLKGSDESFDTERVNIRIAAISPYRGKQKEDERGMQERTVKKKISK